MDEEEEIAERIAELRESMTPVLRRYGLFVEPYRLERDIYVAGSLRDIMEFCQEWRSEIEELG